MGYKINTFNGGINRDIAVTNLKENNYIDALNMQIVSKDNFSQGAIQNEKGMSASFDFSDCDYKEYTFSSDGTWSGTLNIGGDDYSVSIPSTLYKFVNGVVYPITADETYSNNERYSGAGPAGFWISQYDNKIVISSTSGDITLTKSSGTATLVENDLGSELSSLVIIGSINLRDDLILFTTKSSNNTAAPSGTYGQIWQASMGPSGTISTLKLLKNDIFNFSTYYPIEARSNYINELFGKVYFVDGYNDLRHVNIFQPNLPAIPVDKIELLPNNSLSQPLISDILEGGYYESGVVEYAYQLYDEYGAETIISPVSNKVLLTSSPYTKSSTTKFLGDPINENTGKAVTVTINGIDTDFDYIRVFSIHYQSTGSNPVIRIVHDQKIQRTTTIDVIDDGLSSFGTLTLQEFRAYNKPSIKPSNIELIKNRLVLGDVDETYFDITYDARTYRHNSGGEFAIDGGSATTGNDTNWAAVNNFADCVQGAYTTYKYQADGTTIGGEGKKISYEFKTIDMTIDQSTKQTLTIAAPNEVQAWSSSLNGTFVDNPFYSNYASPINSGQMVGYKRGETYRFGIVFINKKGQRSYVKWIGDIKMPEHVDAVSTSYTTYDYTYKVITSPAITTVIDTGISGVEDTVFIDVGSDVEHTYTINFGGETKSFSINVFEYVASNGIQGPQGTPLDEYLDIITNIINGQWTHRIAVDKVYVNDTSHKIQLTSGEYNTALTEANTTLKQTAGGSAVAFTLTTDYDTNSHTSLTTASHIEVSNYQVVAKILYPEFTIKTLPTDEDGDPYAYEIVRVPRKESDKSIVAQGLLFPTVLGGDGTSYYPVVDPTGVIKTDTKTVDCTISTLNSSTLVNFISPEVNFRKLTLNSADTLKPVAVFKEPSYTKHNGIHVFKCSTVLIPTAQSEITIDHGSIASINNDVNEEPIIETINGNTLYNIFRDTKGKKNSALAGTSMFLGLAASTSISGYNTSYALGEIRRTLSKQYGGSTYYNRLNNEYISCGQFNDGSTTVVSVFGGDTYITYFDYQRMMWVDSEHSGTSDSNKSQVILVPLETTVNVDYRYDQCYSKKLSSSGNTAKFVQEKAGDYSLVVGEENNYLQEYDLYLENQIYSKPTESIKYIAEPLRASTFLTDGLIRASEEFQYTDLIDDLIRFLPANYKIVNTEYGSINGLATINNNLVFFQDNAIGVLQIKERSLIQDTEGISLVLGTGDIVGDYKYISTTSGTRHKRSITSGSNGIYYFDSNNKSFNIIGQSITEVSTLKGLSSYLDTNVANTIVWDDRPLKNYGVITTRDKKNNRILLTYLNNSTRFTVSYSELFQVFESFHSYTPNSYIIDPFLNVHSYDPTTVGDYYVHGQGNYGQYYGDYYDSYVTFVSNDQPFINKQFNNVEFDTRVGADDLSSSTDTYRQETISKLQFWTEFQTTNERTIVIHPTEEADGTELKARHRFSKWRTYIPRVTDSGRETRLMDKYLFVKSSFTNNADKRFVLNHFITHYLSAIY